MAKETARSGKPAISDPERSGQGGATGAQRFRDALALSGLSIPEGRFELYLGEYATIRGEIALIRRNRDSALWDRDA